MKRLFFGLMVCAAALVANAGDSYLYWMVDMGDASVFEYSSAKLVATQGSKWTWSANDNVLTIDGGATIASDAMLVDAEAFDSGFMSSIAGHESGWTYFVELLADSGSVVAYSEGLNYASATSYLTTKSQFDAGSADLWTAGSFTVAPIPEPTTGMLMLFGVAALALRRRRQK